MQCPECEKGEIRIIKGVMCTCGHHPLICDNCLSIFGVECGAPYEAQKLPPDFPMSLNEGMTSTFQEMMDGKDDFKEQVGDFPTLDDFKSSLPQEQEVEV